MNLNISAINSMLARVPRITYSMLPDDPTEPIEDLNEAPAQNHLLGGLSEDELNVLLPHLERVDMRAGEVVYQYGRKTEHLYFPATSIVSLIYEMEDGAASEVAVVGNEGVVGVGLLMAGETMPGLAQVQSAGYGFRVSSRVLKQAFDDSRLLQRVFLRYTQALIVEIAQNAVCSRHHSVRQQLCRCLLLSLDRSGGNEMTLTHEMIGASLGVRRECVTGAAGKLRAEGLIDYKRGQITVLDRERLQMETCECYEVIKNTFLRLLPRKCATDPATPIRASSSAGAHVHATIRPLRVNALHAMK